MKLIIQAPIGDQAGLAEIEILPAHTIGEVKSEVCNAFGIDPNTVALMYAGEVLDDHATVAQYSIPENAQLALMPLDIVGGGKLALQVFYT